MDIDSIGATSSQVHSETGSVSTSPILIQAHLIERRAAIDAALCRLAERSDVIAAIATMLVDALQAGGKVLVAGNGGSAAEAQHFAAELVGRFKRERRAFPAQALTVDSSILTAIGNDYGFADVFARQVEAFGKPGDLLLLYSTSGNSENLLRAASSAHRARMRVAAVTGDHASALQELAGITLRVPSTDTPVIQELQMIVTHTLCEIAERELTRDDRTADA